MIENEDEIIQNLKKLASKSNERFHDEIMNMKDSRNFAGGEQSLELSKSRLKSKANLIPRIINTIVNPIRSNPYTVDYSPVSQDFSGYIPRISEFCYDIIDKSNFKDVEADSLKDAVTSGLGGFYVTTVKNAYTKDIEVKVNLIEDSTMIIRDPYDNSINGEKSEEMAIVEIASKAKIKKEYGEDTARDWKRLSIDIEGPWHAADSDTCQLVTYYVKSDEGVDIYKLAGDKIVEHKVLAISDIPVILVKGDIQWEDDQRTLKGITSSLEDVQTLINYTQSQAGQRMKRAPKNPISISKRALEGNEDYYKDSDQNLTPVLPFNDFDPKTGNPIAPPTRFDNTVATEDLMNIMNMERTLLSDISGVSRDMGSVEQTTNETAEGLLLKTKSTESDISHYREHLKSAVGYFGKVILEFYALYNKIPIDEIVTCIKVNVTSGPELVTEKLETRRQLLALNGIVPENMKGVIAYGITNTIDNDEMKSLNKMLFNLLPADVFKDLPQFQQVQIAASQQISQLQMQNKQLQDSVQSLTNQLNALSVNNQVNIVTKKLDNENKIQLKAMEIESKNDIKNKDISYNVAKAQKESELAEKQLQLQTVKAQIEAKKVQNDTIDTKLNLLKGFIK